MLNIQKEQIEELLLYLESLHDRVTQLTKAIETIYGKLRDYTGHV